MSIVSAYSEEKTQHFHGFLSKDLTPQEVYTGEFNFYVSRARCQEGVVLELASGAGRILMTLAQAGITVVGLEASLPMIQLANKAIHQIPPEARKRITIVCGDMRTFAFRTKFRLVIVPFLSFWSNFLQSNSEDPLAQAEMCLRSILYALTPEGKFIIDGWQQIEWWNRMKEKFNFNFEIYEPTRYHEILIGSKNITALT